MYIKEQEDKEWLFNALDILAAPPKKEGSKELEEAEEELRQMTLANSSLTLQYEQVRRAAESHYRGLSEAEERNRQLIERVKQLEAQLAAKTDTIEHT